MTSPNPSQPSADSIVANGQSSEPVGGTIKPPSTAAATGTPANNLLIAEPASRQRDESASDPDPDIAPAPDPSLPTEPEPDRTAFWLRRTDQLVVGLLATVAVFLFAFDYARISGWGARPVEILRLPETEYQYKLNVNQATWVEWALLDGIGEILGKRIVADREKNGPFRSVEDVTRVRGIGPKTMAKMRPWLEVRDEDTIANSSSTGKKQP